MPLQFQSLKSYWWFMLLHSEWYISGVSPSCLLSFYPFIYPPETGCNPGAFAIVLQSLHPDTPLLEQLNTKKLYRTKNKCMHAQLGQILDPKDTKRPKNSISTSEKPRVQKRYWERKQVLCMPPVLNTTWMVGKPPKPPLQLDPRTHSSLYPT